jgi:hypothetical protein
MRYAHLEPNVLKDTVEILDSLEISGHRVGTNAKICLPIEAIKQF